MKITALFATLAVLGTAACSETSTRSDRIQIGSTPALITTADIRIVTERPSPNPSNRNPSQRVLCTEPSPDVAKALSTALQAQGAVSVSIPIMGAVINEAATGAYSRATAEQLAQLTERVPPIQAMRDGLYRACEAYGNGVIGNNAYALILSRYGELLTTLLLAEAAAGEYGHTLAVLTATNAAAPTANAPTVPQVQAPTPRPGTPAPAQAPAAANAGTVSATTPPPAATQTPTSSSIRGTTSTPADPALIRVSDPPPAPAGGAPAPVAAGGTPGGAGAQAHPAGGANPSVRGTRTTRPGSTPTTSADGGTRGAILRAIGNNVPAALELMQYNYLTLSHATPMLVLCANNLDRSVPGNEMLPSWPTAAACNDFVHQILDRELESRRRR